MANEMEGMKKAELLKRLEDGLVPDDEIKKLMEVELQRRLQLCYKPTHQQQLAQLVDFAHSLQKMKLANEIQYSDSQVYEAPVSFLKIMHGPNLKQRQNFCMVISSCYFKDESTTLEQAEIAMLDLYCERAQIRDGMSVLDLGCGLGSLALHVARKYKNCRITAITNSKSQKQHIEDQCKSHNVSNVEVILADVTKHDMNDTFDRIMVIELIEHLKNYQLFLRKISKWLSEDGLLFVEHACHKTFACNFEPLDDDDWLSDYAFPGETFIIPSASFLLYFQDDVTVVDHWILSGKHPSRSHGEWLKLLDANVDAVKLVFKSFLESEEAVMKLINYWRGFCLFGVEFFGLNNGEEWMISQVLFKKPMV